MAGRAGRAQVPPGAVLVINAYESGTQGEVYEVHAGGDVSDEAPFAVPPFGRMPLSMCRQPNGTVLVATCCGPGEGVFAVDGGGFVSFASGLPYPLALLCEDDGNVWLSTFQDGVFELGSGGDLSGATPFATGISGRLLRMSDGSLYIAGSNAVGSGIYDISAGGDFAVTTPFASGETYGIAELGGVLLAMTPGGAIRDATNGGEITSAPIVTTVWSGLSLQRRWSRLWAGSSDGRLYEVTNGGFYGPGQELAFGLAGSVLDVVVAPLCGNGFIEANEACDDGNVVGGDGCDPTCTLESAGEGGGAGGAGGDAGMGGQTSGGGASNGGGALGGAGGSPNDGGGGAMVTGSSSAGGAGPPSGSGTTSIDEDVGGCGCALAPNRSSLAGWLCGSILLGLATARRRARQARNPRTD
jgi:cysteine-rich repeat protein